VPRLTRWLAAALVLALLPTVAVAEPALQDQLRDRQHQQERAQEDLGSVRAEEDSARGRLTVAEAQLAEAEAALASQEAALAEARGRLAEAQAVLEAAEAEQAAARERAGGARRALESAIAELEATEAELAEKQQRLEARIRAAYKYGQVSFAEAFAGVRDIADFLNSSTYVGKVMENDRDLVQGVLELLEQVEAQRVAAQQLRVEAEREAAIADQAAATAERAAADARAAADEVEAGVVAQQRQTEEVASRRADLEAALEDIVEDRQSIESHLAGLEADTARLEGELLELSRRRAEEARQREAEEARQREIAEREAAERAAAERAAREAEETRNRDDGGAGNGGSEQGGGGSPPPPSEPDGGQASPAPPSGSWAWPAACNRVTSRYGARWGRMHSGVDIACTRVMGSNPPPPILASRGGQIHTTNCGGGYGLCVIIDHLDGDLSLYAHMSSLAVGPGQYVQRGQMLGREGSTGNSTGPHLHFEIWKSGSKVDPCPYIGC
jgi:murein DD-endopeptidase MepM/ murein hydrolase activator NlpD